MTMRDINGTTADYLELFGLTRLEASLYAYLLAEGDKNGYEAAKDLGLSRSNAYNSLASLAEKSAAWTIEGSPVRYTAVPAAEFTENRIRCLERARAKLLEDLPGKRERVGAYITIRGRERILDRLMHLVEDASERVYLALHGTVLSALLPSLAAATQKGLKAVIITDPESAQRILAERSLPSATVHTGTVARGQIRAIADSHFVLTGELGGDFSGEADTALYSDEANLVELFKTALKNEIRLIELSSDR